MSGIKAEWPRQAWLGVKPEINAVASLILLSVSLFTFGSWYLMAKAEKRRRAEIAMTTQMQAVV